MQKKDLVAIKDWNEEEIKHLFRTAARIKEYQKAGVEYHPLKGKSLGMLFSKASTRTRVSFEVGMFQLGGYPLYLDIKANLQVARGESIEDTAVVLSRYLDGIMIRTYAHNDVEKLAEFSTAPVINGLTDLLHPCQVLTDIFTFVEHRGDPKGATVAYIGDGNNMAHSWLYGAARTGMNLNIASPSGYEVDANVLKEAKQIAENNNCTLNIMNDPKAAVKDVDVVYTDVWASMGEEEEHAERVNKFKDFQLNRDLLDLADKDALVMHCLPAHRGEEITDDVMDDPKYSVVFDEAENRMHLQKGILYLLMK
ncbi:ornithine carbamoyltransferase [bacterium]|nr:ornithine carbamoyltransferase [bacterium]